MSFIVIVSAFPLSETDAIPIGPINTVPFGYSVESTKMSFCRHFPANFTLWHSGIVPWISISANSAFSLKVMAQS